MNKSSKYFEKPMQWCIYIKNVNDSQINSFIHADLAFSKFEGVKDT